MQPDTDTIVAISTPPGHGGIGIVRLSGPAARVIPASILRLSAELTARRAHLAEILDDTGQRLDQGLVTLFAAPHSYTSEDVLEIAVHGSPVLLESIVRSCVARGARLAQPGEFTQRAFLSGRLDLTQAEAVHDLIAAQTLAQARLAAAQLGGSLSLAIAPIKQSLVALIAALEAGVDFAEDDLDLLPQPQIATHIAAIQAALTPIAATYTAGRLLREGFSLAIVGRPNAGKSSLFNRLLERDRAIVTPHPGTTRDLVSERLALHGIPVELTDTAGLRAHPAGDAEAQGIERTRAAMAEADLVLHVIDATTLTQPPHPEDASIQAAIAARPHLTVLSKSDLLSPTLANPHLDHPAFDHPAFDHPASHTPPSLRPDAPSQEMPSHGTDSVAPAPSIRTSAHSGEGLDSLRQAILTALTGTPPQADIALITNLRQHQSIDEALAALHRAAGAVATQLPHELLLLDLYATLEALDALTGATTPGDILNRIFATFCIGK